MVIQGDTLENSAHYLLREHGITVDNLTELVLFLQKDYIDNLTLGTCLESVDAVLTKREVYNAIITGVQLGILIEEDKLLSPLQEILTEGEGFYGVDEIVTLSAMNVYGSIGFTNYGYIDKVEPGTLKESGTHDGEHVHTFSDDIVGAIAAAAASRLTHSQPDLSGAAK